MKRSDSDNGMEERDKGRWENHFPFTIAIFHFPFLQEKADLLWKTQWLSSKHSKYRRS
jgi:hypothetical protein